MAEETLVVLPAGAGHADLGARVLQEASPRVVVVEGGRPALLPPGGVASATGEVPQEMLDTLDDNERLFVAAFASRRTSPPKQRPGEGLAWDARGFEPPDLPPAQ